MPCYYVECLRNKWSVIIAACPGAYLVDYEPSHGREIVRRFAHEGRLGNSRGSIKRVLSAIGRRGAFSRDENTLNRMTFKSKT